MSLTFLLCVEVFSSPLGTWMVIDLTAKGRFRYGAVIPRREGCHTVVAVVLPAVF